MFAVASTTSSQWDSFLPPVSLLIQHSGNPERDFSLDTIKFALLLRSQSYRRRAISHGAITHERSRERDISLESHSYSGRKNLRSGVYFRAKDNAKLSTYPLEARLYTLTRLSGTRRRARATIKHYRASWLRSWEERTWFLFLFPSSFFDSKNPRTWFV